MSAVYRVQSMCECQALLEADLDASFQVLHGYAIQRGEREAAPGNTVGVAEAGSERFDIVWQCPVCGRNTLRSFHVAALRKLAAPPAVAASEPGTPAATP